MVAGHAGEPAASSGGRAQARRARGEALVVGRAGAASARGGSSRTRVQPGRQRAQTRAHEPTASMAAAKQVNKTASTSTLFHRLNHVLESGRVSEICIEALVALTAAVLCFLIIFGSWRRWCTHWSTQKGLMVAYFMSFSLATYTVGLMQSAALKVEVYPIWAVCFLTIFGCSNSITAYSIDDHKQVFRRVSQDITYVVYLVLILYSVADGVSFIVPFVMLLITLVKVYHRTVASMTVASLRTRTRVIADYMDSKHETRVPYNPVSMTGCRYLVSLRPKGHAIFNREAPRYTNLV